MVILLNILTIDNIEEKINEMFQNKKSKFEYIYESDNENDTLNLGSLFARYLNISDVITLNGELGSGKTVFTKGVGKYFGIENEVSSPTFTIVNEYITEDLPIYHFDVYRIQDVYNFIDTIGTDYFSKGACVIEWGSMLDEILPRNTIHIDFEKIDNKKRKIKIWRK